MPTTIVFNGPPGTGKDEASAFLVNQHGFKALSFKHQLFVETVKLFGVSMEWFMQDYDNREIKERPEEALNGHSRRSALIHTSEEVLKPKFGKGIFGIQASKQINGVSDYCFSDCGFSEELVPVINTVGAENICLVHLLRDNCTYASDSRRYVNGTELQDVFVLGHTSTLNPSDVLPDPFAIRTYQVHNNGTLPQFLQAIKAIYLREQHVNRKTGLS